MIAREDHVAIYEFIQKLFEENEPPKNKMEDLDQWSRKVITQRLIKKVLC